MSFPEDGAIELIGYGRIAVDLHERIGEHRLLRLRDEWNRDAERISASPIDVETLRAMLEDAEAAMMHWAADALPGESPLSDAVVSALNGLADAVRAVKSDNIADRDLFQKFLFYIAPDLVLPLRARDALDVELLTAPNTVSRRGRAPDIGTSTTWLLEALIDDWRRRTGRPVTQATSASSARGFVASFISLMREFSPSSSGGAVQERLAQQIASFGLDLDRPLANAIRGAATRPL